jgi:hypothetical protein
VARPGAAEPADILSDFIIPTTRRLPSSLKAEKKEMNTDNGLHLINPQIFI